MSTGGKLSLHVGLRFAPSFDKKICDRAEGFLKEIERLEEKDPIPLYWNFPVSPLLEGQIRATKKLVALLRRRVGKQQDRIVPSGFLGIPNPLLLPEELKHELLWCYRNPWFPALANLFQMKPDSILPVYPDLLAEATAEVYSRHGFRTIGLPVPLYRLSPLLSGGRWTGFNPFSSSASSIPGSDIHILPIAVIRSADLRQEAITGLLAACKKEDSLHLMFDFGTGDSGNDLLQPAALKLLDMISKHRSIEFLPYSDPSPHSPGTAVDPAELLKYVEPLWRYCDTTDWDRVESLRAKKRRSNLQIRQILTNLAGAAGSHPTDSPGFTTKAAQATLEITNISMAGSVSLIGEGSQQVTFRDGRLTNLIDHGHEILPGVPAQSFFTFDTKKEVLRTESAFSFERGGQTGLRSILSTQIGREQQLQIILDHYFGEEHGRLNLDLTAHYPPLSARVALQSVPLELCLCTFTEEENLFIEASIPGRGRYSQAVPFRQSVIRLYGKTFSIRKGAGIVELEAAPAHKHRTEAIEFRAAKYRGAYRLWVNLGGSYLPRLTALLSTRCQNLSYAVRSSGISYGGKPGAGKSSG